MPARFAVVSATTRMSARLSYLIYPVVPEKKDSAVQTTVRVLSYDCTLCASELGQFSAFTSRVRCNMNCTIQSRRNRDGKRFTVLSGGTGNLTAGAAVPYAARG